MAGLEASAAQEWLQWVRAMNIHGQERAEIIEAIAVAFDQRGFLYEPLNNYAPDPPSLRFYGITIRPDAIPSATPLEEWADYPAGAISHQLDRMGVPPDYRFWRWTQFPTGGLELFGWGYEGWSGHDTRR